MRIRQWSGDDVEQIDVIRSAVQPWHVATVRTQRIWAASAPPQAYPLRLCVEVDGRIVSFAQASLDLFAAEERFGRANVVTDPTFRRRGFATALYERIEEHLRAAGVRRVRGYAMGEPQAIQWVTQRGYVLGHSERFSVVDPRELPSRPPQPAEVTIVSAAEAGSESVHGVLNTAALDIPGDVGWAGIELDMFEASIWSVIDREISRVACVEGVPAAVTLLEVNSATGRALSTGSGTLRRHRGQGLVKLIKVDSLRRAASAGVTAAFTASDSSNHGMLAINAWLGYRDVGSTSAALKAL